jgi:beta-lactam-binding protein with PASTA domain
VSSKRAPSFTVTAAGQKVNLDKAGGAQASFTVTNTSPDGRKGRLLTRPREPAKPEWFSVIGESTRDFAANAADRVVVQLDIPPGSPPGSYSFRLDAVSEDDPDEDYTEGPSVAFEVAPPPQPQKKKFPWWILIVAGAVVLLIVIGVVAWLLLRDNGSKTVPQVVGQPVGAARSALKSAGFKVKTQSIPVSDPKQNGVVQAQAPAAGTDQPSGTAVTITTGRMSTVPKVTGLTEAKAKSAIAKADLKAAVRDVGSEQKVAGKVQSQDPAAATLLPPGTVVTIAVGRSVVVPMLVGVGWDQARIALANAGFRPFGVGVPVADPAQKLIVQSQSPAARTRAPFGSTVTLQVGV